MLQSAIETPRNGFDLSLLRPYIWFSWMFANVVTGREIDYDILCMNNTLMSSEKKKKRIKSVILNDTEI